MGCYNKKYLEELLERSRKRHVSPQSPVYSKEIIELLEEREQILKEKSELLKRQKVIRHQLETLNGLLYDANVDFTNYIGNGEFKSKPEKKPVLRKQRKARAKVVKLKTPIEKVLLPINKKEPFVVTGLLPKEEKPFIRPKAEYSNTSPYGIAKQLHESKS